MYQSPYPQYQPNYGYQPQMIEPPMPTNMPKSSGNFWLGFIGGIITALIIGIGIEIFKRMKASKQVTEALPNSDKKTTIKTIKEEIPKFFEVTRPIEKQTFDEFIEYLQEIGFDENIETNEITGNQVWTDDNLNEIHIGPFDIIVKGINKAPVTFSKKETLFVEFNKNLSKYLNDEN